MPRITTTLASSTGDYSSSNRYDMMPMSFTLTLALAPMPMVT
jgi:hypothetical protein